MCQELIDELEKLVETYACMEQVSSGNPIKDEGFLEAFDIVLGDIRSLIQDYKEAKDANLDRPNIPVGFKLHAVSH